MTAIKSNLAGFIQTSIQSLDEPALLRLCEKLHVYVPFQYDRPAVVTKVTELTLQDQDTALGELICFMEDHKAKKPQSKSLEEEERMILEYTTSFLPKIETKSVPKDKEASLRLTQDQIRMPALDGEIQVLEKDIARAEAEFKATEREMHFGSPSYQKIKQYMYQLAELREKEFQCRALLKEKNARLTKETDFAQNQEAKTREQLAFFISGFAKLRQRHDVVIEQSSALTSVDHYLQEMYLEMAMTESCMSTKMAHTLAFRTKLHVHTKHLLSEAHLENQAIALKMQEQQAQVLEEVAARREALKKAGCCQLQLRRCRKLLRQARDESRDSREIRQWLSHYRQMYLRQLVSHRESVWTSLLAKKYKLYEKALTQLHMLKDMPDTSFGPDVDADTASLTRFATSKYAQDGLAQVLRYIFLVGSEFSGKRTQAQKLHDVYDYVLVDVHALVTAHDNARKLEEAPVLSSSSECSNSNQEDENQLDRENQQTSSLSIAVTESEFVESSPRTSTRLLELLRTRLSQEDCQTRGAVVYNYPLTKSIVDVLTQKLAVSPAVILHLDINDKTRSQRQKQQLALAEWNAKQRRTSSPEVTSDDPKRENNCPVMYHSTPEDMPGLRLCVQAYVRIDGVDSRDGVFTTIEEALQAKMKTRCQMKLRWDDRAAAEQECFDMFVAEAQSRQYELKVPVKKKKSQLAKKGKKGAGAKSPSRRKAGAKSPSKGGKSPSRKSPVAKKPLGSPKKAPGKSSPKKVLGKKK